MTRIGYGAQFNELIVNNDTITKKSKNEYGNFKINKEIAFFKFLINNMISFPIPKIYNFELNGYTMQYLSDYSPLYITFPSFSTQKQNELLVKINNTLSSLHSKTLKTITKNEYTECLIYETYTKIKERHAQIANALNEYSFIKKVNNIHILTFDEVLEKLQHKIKLYLDQLNDYNISIIHGDCQFNNILYKESNEDIVFIDPRGYFGHLDIFGPPEYDLAKIKFALSGYDIFDNMEINSVNIEGDNITIPNIFITNDPNLFVKDDIISILTISIWLGNAHCFKNNIPKAIFSYFYSLYLATLYL